MGKSSGNTSLHLGAKAARFQEFISLQVTLDLALGLTSQEGGVPAPGVPAQFDNEVWKRFEQEFLRS
jgi:hypothetical protein